MRGQNVCRMHGGSAPQSRAAGAERIRALEHPAISRVAHLIDHGDTDAIRFTAARFVLELLGHKATEKIQTDGRTVIEVEYVARTLELPERAG